jgi:4-amino-4-deoxy-L-arabinose transferase-like glycosyltransferase
MEGLVILGLGYASFHNYSANVDKNEGEKVQDGISGSFLRGAMYATLLISACAFVLISIQHPHGNWDAWSIWNLRARFLFRSAEHWEDAFSEVFLGRHPDYPLLVPLTIVRFWTYIGRESVIAPILTAFVFFCGTFLLLFGSLAAIRTKMQGYLGALLLIASPLFVSISASQYADVPLAFFLLSSLVLFTLAEKENSRKYSMIILAGIFASFGAWTKNEGLMVLLSLLGSLIITRKSGEDRLKDLFVFCIGVLTIAPFVILFKLRYAPADPFISVQNIWNKGGNLLNFAIYRKVMESFVHEVFHAGGWNVWFILGLLIYFLICGLRASSIGRSRILNSWLVIVFISAGYFLSYVLTPYPLDWHLGTSLNRLFLQIWPSFLFIALYKLRAPEEIVLKTQMENA